MRSFKKKLTLCFSIITVCLWSQSITLSGKIIDKEGKPLIGAKISITDSTIQYSDSLGLYSIAIPKDRSFTISIQKNNFEPVEKIIESTSINLTQNFSLASLVNNDKIEYHSSLEPVIFVGKKQPSDLTSVELDVSHLNYMPSLGSGVEGLLNTFAVSTASELSSNYRVRGGNYDENLVYINGVEIYRPLTLRSGQQEGMSIINPNMVSTINFSAGGFESRYGDKMSSVLDITYKLPKEFETSLEASLLGGGITLGFVDKKDQNKQKLTGIVGARYRNTNLILNTFDGDTNFNPEYFDVQTFIQYKISSFWKLSFLGNYSSNHFKMEPKSREVEFGTLNNPIHLNVTYQGDEKDKYQTMNGTLALQFNPNAKWAFNLDTYAFHSKEKESFDITSAYRLYENDTETGSSIPTFGIGGQVDHGRNNLDLLVAGLHLKTKYKISLNSNLEAGIQYQREDTRNLKNEWQVLDSLGYSIPRKFFPPGEIDNSDLVLNYHTAANNHLKANRISGYLQYTTKFLLKDDTRVLINTGIRGTYWDFNGETNLSPRAQIAVKPSWNLDMLFRFATGFYYQPPFYKEAMHLDGTLNKNIKSQRSLHFIVGNDFEFKMFKNRPFKLTTEIYYKKMDNLIPYFIDNVRVIYTGENNSKGYAYGIDARLNGEFVPGAESWFSISYGRTEENIDGKGYIPRPTDPRLKLGLFFQDYMKIYPQLKASVNLVYASGLPNGAPLFTDPYQYQTKLSDYKRADIGLTYVFVDQFLNKAKKGSTWEKFKDFSLGLEIFNVFDIKNTISNQWIRDINSPQSIYYAVPNRLTGRFFNLKLNARF